jgi:hypothetical protein
MKVKELVEQLQNLPEECEVLLSRDGEGNSFSKLSDWSLGSIEEGAAAFNVEVDHDADDDYNAVVLWPV